jgi:hypothetical protein
MEIRCRGAKTLPQLPDRTTEKIRRTRRHPLSLYKLRLNNYEVLSIRQCGSGTSGEIGVETYNFL